MTLFKPHEFESVTSTNDIAKELYQACHPHGTAVIAHEQTKGRGRYGRNWSSLKGNLMASILWPSPDRSKITDACFIAALAVYDAIAAPDRLTLKWPNDLLLDEKKIAGILIEPLDEETIIIGIGVNLVAHPLDTIYPTTNLQQALGVALKPQELLQRISQSLTNWQQTYQDQGFESIINAWIQRSYAIGTLLKVNWQNQVIQGFFSGLGIDGSLMLADERGDVRSIHTGEIMNG